ncbi:MAG: M15 family metallopeptidase [Melioribacteraceae bacterium]|jgi:D-alanyl-D-alanine dipeptidase|nr:M15 family metallopeptidase [Melioribacteraceae bacterium]
MKKIILSYIFFLAVVSAQVDTTIVYLGSIDSSIVMDVKYATINNFVGKVLYPTDKVYMRKIVAQKLSEANKYLRENYNLSIKIFDGYRPLSVQKLMWEILPDPRYVADPSKGSRHNRGAAVDITLIDENGNEIEMGTPYDDFTEKAHYDYEELSDDVKANRKLLRDVMIKFGFEPLETEWWHFDFKGWENFPILDYQIN